MLLLAASLVVAGCAPFGPSASRLRVTNAGTVPIQNLIILFPEEKVEFGDVPPGATTEYHPVSKGVYRYAAYSFDLEDKNIGQPVVDWVGEEPIKGKACTYILDLDPDREPTAMIRLQEVREDE
jgi:hypothetical protein